MEAPAINELRQRKQKSEKENSFEREKEISSNDYRDQKETLSDAEREKEIPRGVRAKETPPDVERDKEIDSNERDKEISPNDHKRGKDTPPDDDICPICFEDFKIPCQTNCGHWFCGLYFNLCKLVVLFFDFDFVIFMLLLLLFLKNLCM